MNADPIAMSLNEDQPASLPFGLRSAMRVSVAAQSVRGVRRDANEDLAYISSEHRLFIVADGMGGHEAGEVASRLAVDTLATALEDLAPQLTEADIEERILHALDEANQNILEFCRSNPRSSNAGTTVLVAVLAQDRAYIVSVGDSRAYRFRSGRLQRLTTDDTWPDQLWWTHQITADEARHHPMRRKLLLSLGVEEFRACQEEICKVALSHGDRFMLASNGLTDALDEEQLCALVRAAPAPEQAVQSLMKAAADADAGDDVTCVVLDIAADAPQAVEHCPLLSRLYHYCTRT